MTYTANAEYALDHDPTTGEAETLRAQLAVHGTAIVTATSRHQRLRASYPVPGDLRDALTAALELAEQAAPEGATLAAVEVCDVGTLMARAETPLPDLVGKAGAGRILGGISRQAVNERIATDPTFPAGVDVDGRAAFSVPALQAYDANYRRRPPGPAPGTRGRPRKAAND